MVAFGEDFLRALKGYINYSVRNRYAAPLAQPVVALVSTWSKLFCHTTSNPQTEQKSLQRIQPTHTSVSANRKRSCEGSRIVRSKSVFPNKKITHFWQNFLFRTRNSDLIEMFWWVRCPRFMDGFAQLEYLIPPSPWGGKKTTLCEVKKKGREEVIYVKFRE